MTSVQSAALELIAEAKSLINAGDKAAARKVGRELAKVADVRQLWLINLVDQVFNDQPRTAAAILRQWWESAPTDDDRDLITVMVLMRDGQKPRPTQDTNDRAPRWNSRNKYQAPSTVTTKQTDPKRTSRRSRQEQQDAAAFRRYQAERAGVAEGDQLKSRDDAAHDAQVYASGFDYDAAALYGTRGTRCVDCWVSRGSAEVDAERIKAGHGDDGLCVECRESGRPGIPALPVGHSATDAIYARCSFIWAQSVDAAAARVTLRTEWKQATKPAVKAAIADYVTANLPTEPAAEAPAELDACESCSEDRAARDVRGLATDDGLCAECRAVTAEPAAA